MNKYSDKSDFDINKAVAEITINGDWYLSPTDEQPFTFFNNGINSSKTVELPDYCNNPADAMPIIKGNLISLKHDGIAWTVSCVMHPEISAWDGCENYNDNFYRKAMELFLLMKDAENETSSGNGNAGIN